MANKHTRFAYVPEPLPDRKGSYNWRSLACVLIAFVAWVALIGVLLLWAI
jgi:hypothetical protein